MSQYRNNARTQTTGHKFRLAAASTLVLTRLIFMFYVNNLPSLEEHIGIVFVTWVVCAIQVDTANGENGTMTSNFETGITPAT